MPRTSRTTDPRARAIRIVCATLTSLLAAGCVAMPADGPPEPVDFPQGGGAENMQVRVFPVEPHKGADPATLLAGFLDASNADEANYATALKYLTDDARKRWNPETQVVVLAQSPSKTPPKGDDSGTDVTISGNQVARLDAKHTYRTVPDDPYQQKFTFVKETEGKDKGEWRIDQLPNGLIVDLTNFKNGYRPVHRYFFTAGDPSEESLPNAVLVPDPIYLRRRIDPLTAAARALADGPSDWLAKAVYSTFDGVKILNQVSVNDNRVASVKVSVPDFNGWKPGNCRQMAAQLFYTLADQQAKGQMDRLDLTGLKGGCSVDAGSLAQSAPGSLAGGDAGLQAYYLLTSGQLMQARDSGEGRPVQGALGQPAQAGQPRIGTVAVQRDGNAAAAISTDHRSLYVVGFGEADRFAAPVLTSNATDPEQGLTSPSWDGRGDLWVVDRDPAGPKVQMVRGSRVVQAQVDDLGDRTVQTLKISSDGTRAALVVGDASGASKLMVGLVLHSGTSQHPQVRISGLRPVASMLSVGSVSWADADQLLVLGKEQGKLQQLHYVGTDGSQTSDSPQQVGDLMTSVSTSEARSGDGVPSALAVSSEHKIYRLQGNQWREVAPQRQGLAFTYPG